MDMFEMDDIHKEVLAQNRTYLLKNITLNELFYSELLVKKIFTDEMLDDIQAGDTPQERIGKMLKMLPKRGSDAYDKFIKVLLSMSHGHVAKRLRVTEATERFRRGVRKTMKLDNHMTEKLVLHYTEVNTELEKFHEQRLDIAVKQQRLDIAVKQRAHIEPQDPVIKLDHCRQRTLSLEKELARHTELVRSLAAQLQEMTSTAWPDLDSIRQKLNQYKTELSTGDTDGFYHHMQHIVDYLRNNSDLVVTDDTEDKPRLHLPPIHQKKPRIEIHVWGADGSRSHVGSNATTPLGKRNVKSPATGKYLTTATKSKRRPPSAVRPVSQACPSVTRPVSQAYSSVTRPVSRQASPGCFSVTRPVSGQAVQTKHVNNKQSLLQKPASRVFLLTPPPV